MTLAKDSTLKAGPAVRPRPGYGVLSSAVATTRSEAGIGALMVWADRLWWSTYPAENAQSDGCGIFSLGEDGLVRLDLEHNECHTGRLTHGNYALMGRYRISDAGAVSTITGFGTSDRVCGWTKVQATGEVYALTMEGLVYHYVAGTNTATVIANADTGLNITSGGGDPHFKALAGIGTNAGNEALILVANGTNGDGRLARLKTSDLTWTTDDATGSWIEAVSTGFGNGHGFALGHDHLSPCLMLYAKTPGVPRKFRLPWGSLQWLQMYQQEWMRIRTVETERLHAWLHGLFYELSPVLGTSDAAATDFPRISPMARYSSTITDATVYGGALVLGGNNLSPHQGAFNAAGQPSSSLSFLRLEDVWGWGAPKGWGYWGKAKSWASSETSDPMLAKGFDKKCIHLANGTAAAVAVDIIAYLDHSTGAPDTVVVDVVTVPANGAVYWTAPTGYACDWLAVRPQAAVTSLTARVDFT